MKEEKACEIVVDYTIMTDEVKKLINGIDLLHQKIFDKKIYSTIRYNHKTDDYSSLSKFTTIVN